MTTPSPTPDCFLLLKASGQLLSSVAELVPSRFKETFLMNAEITPIEHSDVCLLVKLEMLVVVSIQLGGWFLPQFFGGFHPGAVANCSQWKERGNPKKQHCPHHHGHRLCAVVTNVGRQGGTTARPGVPCPCQLTHYSTLNLIIIDICNHIIVIANDSHRKAHLWRHLTNCDHTAASALQLFQQNYFWSTHNHTSATCQTHWPPL